jgi:N-glycosylase/DNA lyase
MNTVPAGRIQEAISCIVADIDRSMRDRASMVPVDERGLWTELTCCLLSSQVPYDFAKLAAQRIHEANVLYESGSCERETLEKKLLVLLSTPFMFRGGYRRYRFPKMRSRQLSAAFHSVREELGALSSLLILHPDARCARTWLVQHLPGIGPKQASMFLRNAYGSYDLAILDRHVLRYMETMNLSSQMISNVSSICKYERLEMRLREHADTLGYAVGLLDWAIWIVMKTASGIVGQ